MGAPASRLGVWVVAGRLGVYTLELPSTRELLPLRALSSSYSFEDPYSRL